jgi:UDP-GlcNAc:undecaprenyl-phosphate GlcNAc-1-phosphate transferase
MTLLGVLVFSVLITTSLIPLFSYLAVRYNAVDMPDARKVHTRPIPRVGGVAMAIGIFTPLLIWNASSSSVRAFLAGAAVIILFGIIDDLIGLPPLAKMAGQVMAALIVVFWGDCEIRSLGTLLPSGMILPALVSIPLTLIAVVGVTNAINLADGLDGLAGGISLLIFVCLGILAYEANDPDTGLVTLAFIGSIFGFLRYNTFPASIFMGDTGSQLLGFTAITFSLGLTQGGSHLSPVLPLVLLGFPVLDTLSVMTTRIINGRSPFSPDKNHLHHNLLTLGLRHPESVLFMYIVQTLMVMAAYRYRHSSDWLLLGGYLLFSAVLLVTMSRAQRTGWQVVRPSLVDKLIEDPFRKLRRQGIIMEYALPGFLVLVTALLVSAGVIPALIPQPVGLVALALAGLIIAVSLIRKSPLVELIRIALYIIIPLAVYLGETRSVSWMTGSLKLWYDALFYCTALFTVIISRLSRRVGGFRSTPLDFLIIFTVIAVPYIFTVENGDRMMALVTAKIIILYFSLEVLLAELRGNYAALCYATLLLLLIFGGRGSGWI